jgi:hypothetical protein
MLKDSPALVSAVAGEVRHFGMSEAAAGAIRRVHAVLHVARDDHMDKHYEPTFRLKSETLVA